MNNIKDFIFLIIFGFLVIQNFLVIINILFAPEWMQKSDWLSFPTGEDKKLRKILYCLSAALLFIILFYLRLERFQ
jgi:hypothetical protein